jgi:hypothetical protein
VSNAKLSKRSTVGFVGAGLLACAACCAGPLLAIAGGVGIASAVGAVWVPILSVAAALAAIALTVLLVRRHRATTCDVPAATSPASVSVDDGATSATLADGATCAVDAKESSAGGHSCGGDGGCGCADAAAPASTDRSRGRSQLVTDRS